MGFVILERIGNANAGRIRERTKLTLSTKMLAPDLSG
jgi:hypothetical protein